MRVFLKRGAIGNISSGFSAETALLASLCCGKTLLKFAHLTAFSVFWLRRVDASTSSSTVSLLCYCDTLIYESRITWIPLCSSRLSIPVPFTYIYLMSASGALFGSVFNILDALCFNKIVRASVCNIGRLSVVCMKILSEIWAMYGCIIVFWIARLRYAPDNNACRYNFGVFRQITRLVFWCAPTAATVNLLTMIFPVLSWAEPESVNNRDYLW